MTKWTLADVLAVQTMAPLVTGYLPWTAWSMRPAAVAAIVNEVELHERRSAVELGSGCSTIYLGRALADHGGSLVSVEHDERFAAQTRRVVEREGLAGTVTVLHAPLTPHAAPPDGEWLPASEWYDAGLLLAACPAEIDLLVVDGPPAWATPERLARHPAIPVLAGRLAADWSLFLDDADRPAEQETARLWSAALGVEIAVAGGISAAFGRTAGGPPLAL